jgi:hypothetical protein
MHNFGGTWICGFAFVMPKLSNKWLLPKQTNQENHMGESLGQFM